MRIIFYRLIYNPFINKILRGLIKKIFHPVPQKYRIAVSGKLRYNIGNKEFVLNTNETCYVTQLIYWNGGILNYEYSSIFLDLVKKCDVFFDIGAQLGYYSILGKKVNEKLNIYAFEPSNGPKYYLRKNLIENKVMDGIKFFDLALSDKNGTIDFYENYNIKYPYIKYPLRGGNNFYAPNMATNNKFKVKTKTIDHFIKEQNITSLSLIKIDTEGTEHIILQKGIETIRKFKPLIICEILIELCWHQLLKLLLPEGYVLYYHIDGKLINHTNYDFSSVPKDVSDYFFVHKDGLDLIEKYIQR